MQTGRETLKSIESALRDLQAQERQVRAELERNGQERSDLLSKRLSAFRELAVVRNRHAVADGVIDDADRLTDQVKGILQARQKTVDGLAARSKTAEASREEKLAALDELLETIETHEQQLDNFAKQARRELSDNRAYRDALAALQLAQKTYQRAQEKTAQAEKDRKRKGAPYKNDPLFMYLWQRNYGSNRYQATGLIKWLDEKVAGLVGYHSARANYALLNEIPIRLAEHSERLGAKWRLAQEAADNILAAKVAVLAGDDLPRKLKDFRQKQKLLNLELEQLAGELSETASQINIYAEGKDRSFLQATELAAQFLEQESLQRLRALARKTQEPTDDQIVARIRQMESKIEQLRTSAQSLQAKLEKLFNRKEDLIRLAADFRRNYYDESNSVFEPGADGSVLLEQLLRGAITVAEYWMRAQQGHRWRNRDADPFRRSSGLPPLQGGFDWPSGSSNRQSGDEFTTGGGF